MAVSKPVRPSMLIRGTVLGIENQPEYDREGKKTGNVGRRDVKLLQEGFSVADVRFPNRPDAPPVPGVGEVIGLMVELGESREWGSSLTVVGYVTGDELEAFHALMQPATK
ncbi:hypothetical protein [Microbacterium capsulatum]|uniref:Uncharacterized protein n=1 Tax=Microbacterium capsulatum TaxID=3041921 RepID=A0ABU0XE19_9MICO|nr:hypothetical protein [Microbacterium sp. ASV81]MDQ4213306.1 hypothetical protein [Microbacterium sp. ASV81]